MKKAALLILSLAMILLLTACGGNNIKTDQTGSVDDAIKETAAKPAPSTALSVPTSGTAGQRMQELWEKTKPIIIADAKAGYSDKEYVSKRAPLFDVWVNLQAKLAFENADNASQKVIPDVLSLIDKLYGIDYFPEAKRIETRATTIKSIDSRVQALDEKIAALK